MLVRNDVIEKMFIETTQPRDRPQASDADTMLQYLASDHKPSASISLFSKPGGSYCAKAKQLLADSGIPFEEIPLGKAITTVSLRAISGRETVPQIYRRPTHRRQR